MSTKKETALLENESEFNKDKRSDLHQIDPRKIKPNPNNKRVIDVDSDDMQSLIASIDANGIITPLMIKPNPNFGVDGDNYEYIAYGGNRRITGTMYLIDVKGKDIKYVPCQLSKRVKLEDELLTQLTENSAVPYTPIEKAEVIADLVNNCGWTPKEVSEKTGETEASISNLLQIAAMPKKHKKMITDNIISTTLALQIIRESDTPEEFDASMDELFKEGEKLKAQGKTAKGKRALVTKKKAKGVVKEKTTIELLEELCLYAESEGATGEKVDFLNKVTNLLRKADKDTLKKMKALL